MYVCKMSTEVLEKALENKDVRGLEGVENLVQGMKHMPATDAFEVMAILCLGYAEIFKEIEVELVRRRIQESNRPANRP